MIYDSGFLAWVSDILHRLDDSEEYEPPENFIQLLKLQRIEPRYYTHIDKEMR